MEMKPVKGLGGKMAGKGVIKRFGVTGKLFGEMPQLTPQLVYYYCKEGPCGDTILGSWQKAPRSKDNRNWNQGISTKTVKIKDASEKAMCDIYGAGFDWSDMAEEEIQANMVLMAFSYSKVTNDKPCLKNCLKNYEALKKQYDDLLVKLTDTNFKAATYKRGLTTLEGQIVKYREHEVLFSEEIALLKRSVGSKEYHIGLLRAELEKVKQEKEGFEFKIAKFDKSAKDLEQLLGSQITDKSKKGFGYNVVPSPHPLILNRPTTLDLSYSGLEEFKEPKVNEYGPRDYSLKPTIGCDKESDNYKENTDDSLEQHQITDTKTSSVKSSLKVDKDWKEKFFYPANHVREVEPKKVRENNDAPIIEDWVSDDEDDDEPNPKVEKKTVIPTATKKEFVKPEKPVKRSVRYAEMYRSQRPRGNQRNWNGQKSNQLGCNFVFNNKACFICGSFDHIQYSCPNQQRKRIVSGNNYNKKDNDYYSKTSHSSAHKHMAPKAVLMRTGLKSVNTARPVNTVRSVNTGRPFSTARSFNTVRPSYTAHPKSTIHCARPRTYFQNQAQSTIHRPFYKRTTLTKRCFNQRFNTGRPFRSTVNTVRARGFNAVKPSACWVWRPIKPNGASLSNSQLNDKGFVDSGCSRHMTGNIAHLSDFKDFDRGYVTFGGGAYGGRITGKGTIKTDNLDFDDVYFVKELKQATSVARVKAPIGFDGSPTHLDEGGSAGITPPCPGTGYYTVSDSCYVLDFDIESWVLLNEGGDLRPVVRGVVGGRRSGGAEVGSGRAGELGDGRVPEGGRVYGETERIFLRVRIGGTGGWGWGAAAGQSCGTPRLLDGGAAGWLDVLWRVGAKASYGGVCVVLGRACTGERRLACKLKGVGLSSVGDGCWPVGVRMHGWKAVRRVWGSGVHLSGWGGESSLVRTCSWLRGGGVSGLSGCCVGVAGGGRGCLLCGGGAVYIGRVAGVPYEGGSGRLVMDGRTGHRHNMAAFLEKSTGSEGFHQVIDFQSQISYALTKKPEIYISFIKQFWRTAKASTDADGELDDHDGITSIPNSEIFEQLALMGYHTDSDKLTFQKGAFSPQWRFLIYTILHCLSPKKTAWEQFSSNIATVVIYMQKKQLKTHSSTYLVPSLNTKVFSNMRRVTKGYTWEEIGLFPKYHVPTPNESPLHAVHSHGSAEGSLKLNELTTLVTKLSERIGVLEDDLKNTKLTYSAVVTNLILRVKKLETQVKAGTARKRARVVLSEDDEDDSSKHGRKLSDAEVQEKASTKTEPIIQEVTPTEVIQDQGSSEKGNSEVSTAGATKGTASEVPVVSTAEVNISTAGRTVTYRRRSEEKMTRKDKGKAIMTEPEQKKKSKKELEQERLSFAEAIRLQEQMDEEQRAQIARDEEIARQWDEEEGQRAMSEAKSSKKIDWNDPSVIRYHALKMKPKTVAQARRNMVKYLKNQGNYKISDFKGMSYNEIRPIFEKVWDFNQHIEPMDLEHGSERMKSPEKIEEEDVDTQKEMKEVSKESGAKRKKSLPRKSTRSTVKRQKMELDDEKEDLKGYLDIVPREDVAEDVESLSTKYPIVDWKTYTLSENFMYYKIIRGDGSSKNYKILSEMLYDFDRQDIMELYRLVKERYSSSKPEGYDLMLWGDLHTLFEPDEESEIWMNQNEYNLISWSLCDLCGVHILLMQNGIAIHMLTEKKYPLSQEMISKMLNKRLEVDHESTQAYELLKFIRSQVQK
ncbi:hypothetical protein Tco_0360684 [Tanacetum coccineum]